MRACNFLILGFALTILPLTSIAQAGTWGSSLWGQDTWGVRSIATAPSTLSVSTSDPDGAYTVSWTASATTGASYTLEEATNSTFTTGLRTAYSGTGLTTNITGRATATTYFYRVKATKSGYTDSPWTVGTNGCTVSIPSTVTATAGTGGTVTPSSRSVVSGSTASYTISSSSGYTKSSTVGGTCPAGSWSGDIYTTGAINSNCSVSFSFTQNPIAIANVTCATVDSNFNVEIPCLNAGGGEFYQVTLNKYQNPANPFGFFWSLGEVTPATDNGSCASVDLNTMQVSLPCVNVSGTEYSVDLTQYSHPTDHFQFYWSLGAVR